MTHLLRLSKSHFGTVRSFFIDPNVVTLVPIPRAPGISKRTCFRGRRPVRIIIVRGGHIKGRKRIAIESGLKGLGKRLPGIEHRRSRRDQCVRRIRQDLFNVSFQHTLLTLIGRDRITFRNMVVDHKRMRHIAVPRGHLIGFACDHTRAFLELRNIKGIAGSGHEIKRIVFKCGIVKNAHEHFALGRQDRRLRIIHQGLHLGTRRTNG